MKFAIVCLIITLASVLCEPPVPHYLPANDNSQQYANVPSSQYGPPNVQYELPTITANRARTFNNGFNRRPFQLNGNFRKSLLTNGSPATALIQPKSVYGVPSVAINSNAGFNYGRVNGYDDQSEPANYQFEYTVTDGESASDFGHMEERQGDNAQGRYYVLLPDGRRQIVDYEADTDGFKPRISYEEIGYNARSRNNNGGYHY